MKTSEQKKNLPSVRIDTNRLKFVFEKKNTIENVKPKLQHSEEVEKSCCNINYV